MGTDQINNLIKIGSLKSVTRDDAEIKQMVKVASDALADAQNTSNSAHTRYMAAYDGIHSLGMAVLLHNNARPSTAPGHRVIAIQTLSSELGLGAGKFKIINDAHNRRNETTYQRALPPIEDRDAQTVVQVLQQILPEAKAYLGL